MSLQHFVHHSISVPKAAPGVFGSPTTSKTSLKARVEHVVISSRLLNHPMCTALWLFLFLRSSGFPRRCKICRVEIKLPYLLFVKSSLQNNCSNEKPPFSFREHLCSPSTHILVLFDFCKPKFLDLRAVSVLMDRLIYLCSQPLVCQWDFFNPFCSLSLLVTPHIPFLYGFQSPLSLWFHPFQPWRVIASHLFVAISAQLRFCNEKQNLLSA